MKKKYINPTIEVVKIASQMQMLAGSGENQIPTGSTLTDPASSDARELDFDDEDEY